MLLFDQNLSYKLCETLAKEFPGCLHVRDARLSSADDAEVWNFAAASGLIVVSKDQDFRQRALLFGPPPKSPVCLSAALALSGSSSVAKLAC